MKCQLLNYRFSVIEYICPEVKFFFPNRIISMSSLEILLNVTHWNVKIYQFFGMKCSRKEVNNQTKRSILLGSKLNFHSSKFNSPSNRIIDRYFKSDRIPISSIQHFKNGVGLFSHSLKFLMSNQDVSFKYICNMVDQIIVDLNPTLFGLLCNVLLYLRIYVQFYIIVFRLIELSWPYVQVGH